MTKVRRRVVWEQYGRRCRKNRARLSEPASLLTGRERLSDKGLATMGNSLIDSEPTGQVLTA